MSGNPFVKKDPISGECTVVESVKERKEMVDAFDLFTLQRVAMDLLDIRPQASVRKHAIKRLESWKKDNEGNYVVETSISGNDFSTAEINVECVLVDTSSKPSLYLEEYNGEEKANYWTDEINRALVYDSLMKVLPVYKHVSYKGNVEIKQIIKN